MWKRIYQDLKLKTSARLYGMRLIIIYITSKFISMDQVTSNIFSTKEKVEKMLESLPHLRDSDDKLVANFWHREVIDSGKKISEISAFSFMKMYSEGELTKADVITRARRKAQEHNPKLRGEKWEERHGREKEVRKNINS